MGLFDFFRKKNSSNTLTSGTVTEEKTSQTIADNLSQYKIGYDIQTPAVTQKRDSRKSSRMDISTWF